jgi:hypothetical protein
LIFVASRSATVAGVSLDEATSVKFSGVEPREIAQV